MQSPNDLADEISKVCQEGKTGALLISDGRNNGKIFLANGAVVNVEFGTETGQAALTRVKAIVRWKYAIFVAGQVKPSADADLPDTEQFLRGLRTAPMAAHTVAEQPPRHGNDAAPLPPAEQLEEIIRAQLARSLGPAANVIVKQQRNRIVSLHSRDELGALLRDLAAKIPDPAAADNFLSAVSHQTKT